MIETGHFFIGRYPQIIVPVDQQIQNAFTRHGTSQAHVFEAAAVFVKREQTALFGSKPEFTGEICTDRLYIIGIQSFRILIVTN